LQLYFIYYRIFVDQFINIGTVLICQFLSMMFALFSRVKPHDWQCQ